MKKLSIAFALLCAASWSSATGVKPPSPDPTPNPQQQQQQQQMTGTQNQVLGVDNQLLNNNTNVNNINNYPVATGGSVGDINLQGGNSNSGAAAFSGGSRSGASSNLNNQTTVNPVQSFADNGRMYSLTFAPPAWATLPVATNCMASTNKARSFVFGAASWADATQTMDPICTTIELAQRARLACHFESAWLLESKISQMLLGVELGSPPKDLRNYGPEECEQLKRPHLRPDLALAAPPVVKPDPVPPVNQVINLSCPEPAVQTKYITRYVKNPNPNPPKNPPCVNCCPKEK